MAAERCKYATFLPRCSEKKLLGQMSSTLEEIMQRDFVYCMKLILKEFMIKKIMKIEKYPKNVQLSQTKSGP